MKPFQRRLVNVFAAFLNLIVVVDLVLSITNLFVMAREGLSNDGAIIGSLVFLLPIVLVATTNYLTFGKLRAWNRLTN